MDANAKSELNSIKRELNSIITELEQISYGVRHDFVGIGNDYCASSIDRTISQYRTVKRKLDNLDTQTVTAGFAKAMEGK